MPVSNKTIRILQWAERGLWAAAGLCLVYILMIGIESKVYAKQGRVIGSSTQHSPDKMNQVIGRIEIPALGLVAPITRDYDVNSLRRGVGHIPSTAEIGGLGTVGLAGHRDSFFRPLRRIAPNMQVRLTGTSGAYDYIVDSTEVVDPDQVRVLDLASRPELTLITCFPFDYVGAAPRRFIVHAHLVSVVPEEVAPSGSGISH